MGTYTDTLTMALVTLIACRIMTRLIDAYSIMDCRLIHTIMCTRLCPRDHHRRADKEKYQSYEARKLSH